MVSFVQQIEESTGLSQEAVWAIFGICLSLLVLVTIN